MSSITPAQSESATCWYAVHFVSFTFFGPQSSVARYEIGIPFAVEGLFFFTEAIFVAIYIFGWRRLRPWTHFWTGVPIALAGVFASIIGIRNLFLIAGAVCLAAAGITALLFRADRGRLPAGGSHGTAADPEVEPARQPATPSAVG
mgnify:CR=1 FL=1